MNYLAHIFLRVMTVVFRSVILSGMGSKGTGINNIPGNSSKEFCYTAKSMLSRTGIRWSGKP